VIDEEVKDPNDVLADKMTDFLLASLLEELRDEMPELVSRP